MEQNKQIEIDFFDSLQEDYNVFTEEANQKIIQTVMQLLKLRKEDIGADLGCGSGVFSQLLKQKGYEVFGLDLSQKLLLTGKQQSPDLNFVQGDVEFLPFADNSLDFIILSALVHHLPSPQQCAKEVYRVLKPQGRFVAFDPNRLNPFMYLYRDKSSPFYSPKGVTPNERPVIPRQIRQIFKAAGFQARSEMINGLSFRYVASDTAKSILPIYNFIDKYVFHPFWMRPFRAFVFTYGIK